MTYQEDESDGVLFIVVAAGEGAGLLLLVAGCCEEVLEELPVDYQPLGQVRGFERLRSNESNLFIVANLVLCFDHGYSALGSFRAFRNDFDECSTLKLCTLENSAANCKFAIEP
jgi:hypothetical protein